MSNQKQIKKYVQLAPSDLVTHAIQNGEGELIENGALSVNTGKYTGRSPKDKFIVMDNETEDKVNWGKVNQPIDSKYYERLKEKMTKYSNEVSTYEFNGYIGTDETYRIPVRVITEYAWHNLFAHQLLVRPTKEELEGFRPLFTVIDLPNLQAIPEFHGTNSETFIITSIKDRMVLIGGTEYAGEIKKSLFGIMNHLLPEQNVLPMHCSANVGEQGDVSLFFGLSGTGKTTLSSSSDRRLIGDDEHGWTKDGVFNFEGGCYAKTISLSEQKEPEIYNAIRFGSILENVVVDENKIPDYDDGSLTENTRTAYPIHYIENIQVSGKAGVPNTIFFLTADAFGVLPAISKLTEEQAKYYFLNGYTSKLAGTERGVTEPEATFSTCFGEPFFTLPPSVYADMLEQKIKEHGVDVYLINTGWLAGGYGKSERIPLKYTRSMIQAAINGEFKTIGFEQETIFGLEIPTECPDVPSEWLNPMNSWTNKEAYIEQATNLRNLFEQNYQKYTQPTVKEV